MAIATFLDVVMTTLGLWEKPDRLWQDAHHGRTDLLLRDNG